MRQRTVLVWPERVCTMFLVLGSVSQILTVRSAEPVMMNTCWLLNMTSERMHLISPLCVLARLLNFLTSYSLLSVSFYGHRFMVYLAVELLVDELDDVAICEPTGEGLVLA